MPTRSGADPDGRIIIADGRNHLELATEQFDIMVTDPPPPIESSGASVISSLEYYRAGHDHLTPGGVMMQWVPFGAPEEDFKDHVRTFASVYPNVMVIRGAGGYGAYMLGSDEPLSMDPDVIREILARPGCSPTSRPPTTRRRPRSRTGSPSSRASMAGGDRGHRLRGTRPADHR